MRTPHSPIKFKHLIAKINVAAPANAVIDILQNQVVLQTYTLGSLETQHSSNVDISNTLYTVRATLGIYVQSTSVLVELPTTYEVILRVVKQYLFKDGNEYSAITGGWIGNDFRSAAYGGTRYAVSKNIVDNQLYFSMSTNSTYKPYQGSWFSQSAIDFKGYTKLHVHFSQINMKNTYPSAAGHTYDIIITDTFSDGYIPLVEAAGEYCLNRTININDVPVELNISDLNDSYYIANMCCAMSGSVASSYCYQYIDEISLIP